MKLLAVIFFLFAQTAIANELIKQEVVSFEESDGMQVLYMIGASDSGDASDQASDYASLDCQSLIHELKFIKDSEEVIYYMVSDYECQELYQDLLYRMEAGKKTCLMLNPVTEKIFVRVECSSNPT